ncbi:MAG: hypothetical protein R6U95_01780 [Bacteroidales bacterium]
MIYKRIFFASLILLLCTTCAKRTENMIIGEWSVENVGEPGFPDDATWRFYDNGKLEVYHDLNALPDGLDVGEWEAFNRSVVTPYIKISGFGERGLTGKWRVEKLTNKILVLNRVEFNDGETAGSFMRREFIKE